MINMNRLFKRSVVQPFSDPAPMRTWLTELKKNNADWLQESCSTLKTELEKNPSLSIQALDALLDFDAAIQEKHQADIQYFLANPHIAKSIANQLMQDINTVNETLITAYRRYIELNFDHPDEQEIEERLHSVHLRTLNYMNLKAVLLYTQSDPLKPEFWELAGRIYRLAELTQKTQKIQAVYPIVSESTGKTTSIADLYIKLLLLELLNTGSFNAKQIYNIDQWLEHWTETINITRSTKGQHVFCIDLAKPANLMLLPEIKTENDLIFFEKKPENEMFRYINLDELLAEVDRCIQHLQQGKQWADLRLGLDSLGVGALELLKRVRQYWGRTQSGGTGRRSERVKVKKIISVVHGINTITNTVRLHNQKELSYDSLEDSTFNYDEVRDLRLYGFVSSRTKEQHKTQGLYGNNTGPIDSEEWIVENESEGGLGVLLKPVNDDWVKQGTLLAIRSKQGNVWHLGLVRRLQRIKQEQIYAGIEILTEYKYTLVRIATSSTYQNSTSSSSYGRNPLTLTADSFALYLIHHTTQQESLILPISQYAPQSKLHLSGAGMDKIIQLKTVQEKGIDWIWAQLHD